MRNPIVVAVAGAFAAALFTSSPALAQYTQSAGESAPAADMRLETATDAKGVTTQRWVAEPVKRDSYGNAQSSQHDLAVDGAFDGQTVAVIQLYAGTDNGFA